MRFSYQLRNLKLAIYLHPGIIIFMIMATAQLT